MGRLSTHVLDTANGCPAHGIKIELFRLDSKGVRHAIAVATTNADGRTENPLLDDKTCLAGWYELNFHIGPYFEAKGTQHSEMIFLDLIPIRFHIADPNGRYHVTLVCSPWSYSTYRGS